MLGLPPAATTMRDNMGGIGSVRLWPDSTTRVEKARSVASARTAWNVIAIASASTQPLTRKIDPAIMRP